MRRFLTLVAAMAFIGVMGCKHTAGICDCCQDQIYNGPPVLKPEPLPIMPKVQNGDKAKAKDVDGGAAPKEIQLDKELPLGNER